MVEIKIDDITINKKNARHGELSSEIDAINWILNDNPNRLMALAKDIANVGYLFERPLLRQEGRKYVVYDGNRRITCLKLLNNPEIINDTNWKKIFLDLKQSSFIIPSKIDCDVSGDISFINNLVERRHVGGETGSGQVKWSKTQKENHLILTGRKDNPSFTVYLQDELRKRGMISEKETLKHSIFERLLSNNSIRERLGFSVARDGKVKFSKKPEEVFNTVLKIHNDLEEGAETLNTLWDMKGKNRYLDSLQHSNYLPITPVENSQKLILQEDKSKKKNIKKQMKTNFIDIDFPMTAKTNEEIKIKNIWEEMQYRLTIMRNPYSLGVMTRVLIELVTDYYIGKHKIKAGEKLHQKVLGAIEYLQSMKYIFGTEANILKGTANIDINTLHSFVHNLNAHPTEKDLVSLWGKFKNYIVLCLTK